MATGATTTRGKGPFGGFAPLLERAKALPFSIWCLVIGLSAIIGPSIASLAQQTWSTDVGVHGPIILATGIWLLVRAWPEVKHLRSQGNGVLACAGIAVALLAYIGSRAFDFISIEIASVLFLLLSLAYWYVGSGPLKRMWFPIFYMGFVIPFPGWVIDQITAPLKLYVSWSATKILAFAGYPIVREGVTLYVDQYQLLVEDACAGLNSIISLTAIGLFYIYLLHNTTWRYALLLFCWIIPAALFANLVRVMLLVLITYHFGNAAAQGFLHSTAGIVMFVAALLGIFVVDKLMDPIRRRLMAREA
jgi:exosortase B